MNKPEKLVEEYRNGILECVHFGHIAIVSPEGLKYSVGINDDVMFYRSASKPVQALPVIHMELDKKYGLTEEEVTIMSGSQRCEFVHVEVIESLIKKTCINEEILIMCPTYPLDPLTKEEMLRRNMPPRKIYHNCIGKHIACILLQRELGGYEEEYWKLDSPAQQLIMDFIAQVSEYPREKIKTGVDGCGVPVFAVPLQYIANTFLRLACPELIKDTKLSKTVERNSSLMNKYPRLISGSNAICTLLNEDDNIVAKGGALGVYCFGLRKEKLGVAYKVEDGSYDELPLIAATILEYIKYDSRETIERILKHFPKEIKNDCGKIVGEYVPVFNLEKRGREQ
ncbi:MAG TPA: asparaginase [Clostridiaceae bacterium]|nr:asparaginase [Clostridiaceae bacterium]